MGCQTAYVETEITSEHKILQRWEQTKSMGDYMGKTSLQEIHARRFFSGA